jgi:hypothetical protein
MVYAKDTFDDKFGASWVSLERSRDDLVIKKIGKSTTQTFQ